jgi:hypothetical protein
MAVGPVELLIIKFPRNKARGEIAPALTDLNERVPRVVIDELLATRPVPSV